jgi:hypothetical protein
MPERMYLTLNPSPRVTSGGARTAQRQFELYLLGRVIGLLVRERAERYSHPKLFSVIRKNLRGGYGVPAKPCFVGCKAGWQDPREGV